MLRVHFMCDGSYPGRHVAEGQREAGRRGLRQDYYSRAAEAGEPPGRWMCPGLSDLGLESGSEVSQSQMHSIYTQLVDPRTGESIGTPLRHYASRPQNLAKAAECRGLEIGADLSPAAVRARIDAAPTAKAKQAVEASIEAEIAASVPPEEMAALRREATKAQRKARTFVDLTASPDKSWSILHAAAEANGNPGLVAEIEAAQADGAQAALDVFMREAGYSRAGYHGTKVGGRTSGRWVEGKNWVVASFVHHLSREGDPQLHTHLAV